MIYVQYYNIIGNYTLYLQKVFENYSQQIKNIKFEFKFKSKKIIKYTTQAIEA